MNEEVWKHYRPIEGLESNYYFLESADSYKGLSLLFSGEKSEEKGIKVIFEHSYEIYRCTEEGGRYRKLCNLIDQYGQEYISESCIYLVENSKLADWLVHESFDVAKKEHLLHFSFLSVGVYIDVVAVYHPKIIHVDIPQEFLSEKTE